MKVEKFDFTKLREGMEIFDIVNGWHTVDMINKDSDSMCIYVKRYEDNKWHDCFTKCGRGSVGDVGIRIVAMRNR